MSVVSNGCRSQYTKTEKARMLLFLEDQLKENNIDAFKPFGNKLWEKAVSLQVTSHSMQSMRDHMRRNLIKNLEVAPISQKTRDYIKSKLGNALCYSRSTSPSNASVQTNANDQDRISDGEQILVEDFDNSSDGASRRSSTPQKKRPLKKNALRVFDFEFDEDEDERFLRYGRPATPVKRRHIGNVSPTGKTPLKNSEAAGDDLEVHVGEETLTKRLRIANEWSEVSAFRRVVEDEEEKGDDDVEVIDEKLKSAVVDITPIDISDDDDDNANGADPVETPVVISDDNDKLEAAAFDESLVVIPEDKGEVPIVDGSPPAASNDNVEVAIVQDSPLVTSDESYESASATSPRQGIPSWRRFVGVAEVENREAFVKKLEFLEQFAIKYGIDWPNLSALVHQLRQEITTVDLMTLEVTLSRRVRPNKE